MEKRIAYLESELARLRDANASFNSMVSTLAVSKEKAFKEVLQNASDVIGILSEDGTILFLSESIAKIFGFKPAELLLHNAFERVHSGDMMSARAAFEECLAQPNQNIMLTLRYLHKDETYRVVELIANNQLHCEGVEGIITTVRDVTERNKAQAQLKSQEQFYRALINSSFDSISLLDAEGIIQYMSPSCERIIGIKPEMSVGQSAFPLIHPDDRERMRKSFRHILASPEKEIVSACRVRRNTGEWRWIEGVARNLLRDPNIQGIIINWRDETERHCAEKELQESQERFQRFFEDTNIGIVIVGLNNSITAANQAFCTMLGYSEAELKNLNIAAITPPDDLFSEAETFKREILEERKPFYRLDKRYLKKDGSPLWARITAASIFDASGSLRYGIRMAIDISAEKKMLEEKEMLSLKMVQTQKMEALGTLSGGVAHDFNNILTAIGLAAQRLQTVQDPHKRTTYLNNILNAVTRGAEIASQLLAFSRKPSESTEPILLSGILKNVIAILDHTLQKNILIEFEREEELPVLVNASELYQVFLNLGINARDAMPDGGQLRYTVSLNKTGTMPQVVVTVSDTGIGIDPEVMKRIFEPFFTTKEIGKGTGLGLSIVHGVVARHGGTIDVQSQAGKGSIFTLMFPAHTADDEIKGRPHR
jgi:two-component system, cell cycle sensor histidine kinase and response regulator CckA